MKKSKLNRGKNDDKGQEAYPALAFIAPKPYADFFNGQPILNQTFPKNKHGAQGKLAEDHCVITYPDQSDHFIRVTLTQKIVDDNQDLEYGLWVSVSAENYQKYIAGEWNQHTEDKTYGGYLCNSLPGYDLPTYGTPCAIVLKEPHQRPEIVPSPHHTSQFVLDYWAGIDKTEALKRIRNFYGVN